MTNKKNETAEDRVMQKLEAFYGSTALSVILIVAMAVIDLIFKQNIWDMAFVFFGTRIMYYYRLYKKSKSSAKKHTYANYGILYVILALVSLILFFVF